MKDRERKFFRYVVRQIDYENADETSQPLIEPLDDIIATYADKHILNVGILNYYMRKWKDNKLFDFHFNCNENCTTGYFLFPMYWDGDYHKYGKYQYFKAIPLRVKRKLDKAFKKGEK